MSAKDLAELIFPEILRELELALKKFPTWPTDPLHALAVLGEEYGELVKGLLQMVYEPNETTQEKVYKEAMQTAAMVVRLTASLDMYHYQKSHQHHQGGNNAKTLRDNQDDTRRLSRLHENETAILVLPRDA